MAKMLKAPGASQEEIARGVKAAQALLDAAGMRLEGGAGPLAARTL